MTRSQRSSSGPPDTALRVVLAVAGLATSVLLLVSPVQLFSFDAPPYGLVSVANAFESIAIVLLTLGVYLVYRDQRDIAQIVRQSTVGITDYNFIPLEEVNQRHPINTHENLMEAEFAEATVSNYSEGPAFDFQAELYIEAGGREFTSLNPVIDGDWKHIVDKAVAFSPFDLIGDPGASGVKPTERGQRLAMMLRAPFESLPESWSYDHGAGEEDPLIGPTSFLEHITETTEHDVLIGVHLWYRDANGLQGPKYIKYVQVENDAPHRRSTVVSRSGLGLEGRIDLHDIFHDVGRKVDQDQLPDLEHPNRRL